MLKRIAVSNAKIYTLQEIKLDYETKLEDFELFWFSKPIVLLKDNGLLII
jgi:RecJ-like exonuclease